MRLQPLDKQLFHLVWQAKENVGCLARARIGRRRHDPLDFRVIDRRDQRGHQHAGRYSGFAEFFDGTKASFGGGNPRLHDSFQRIVQGRQADCDRAEVELCQLLENIEIANHKMAFRDQADRVLVLEESLEQLPRDGQRLFGRLIRIRVRSYRDGLADVAAFFPGLQQSTRGIRLVENTGLEIQAGRQVEVAVAGPGITIDAAMLTALVGVDGPVEGYVRGCVVADDRAGLHGRQRRCRVPFRPFRCFLVVEFNRPFVETTGGT